MTEVGKLRTTYKKPMTSQEAEDLEERLSEHRFRERYERTQRKA
mgnify:CR=1 FL=1